MAIQSTIKEAPSGDIATAVASKDAGADQASTANQPTTTKRLTTTIAAVVAGVALVGGVLYAAVDANQNAGATATADESGYPGGTNRSTATSLHDDSAVRSVQVFGGGSNRASALLDRNAD